MTFQRMTPFCFGVSNPTGWHLALGVSLLIGCQQQNSGYQPYSNLPGAPQQSSTRPDAPLDPLIASDESQVAGNPIAHTTDSPGDSSELVEDVPVSAMIPVNVIEGNANSVLKVASQNAESTPIAPRIPKVLITDKTFRTEGPEGALRLSFDDIDLLKVLNMDPVTPDAQEMMPGWLSGLDGQRVRLRGFMYPTYESTGLTGFALARDNQICCFGRSPKVYDLVQIAMRPGKVTDYIPPTRPFDVVGVLRIQLMSEGDVLLGLYAIEDAEVIDRKR